MSAVPCFGRGLATRGGCSTQIAVTGRLAPTYIAAPRRKEDERETAQRVDSCDTGWVKGVKIEIHSGCGSVVLVQETAEVLAALDGTSGR
jgi:hypothetical protein